MSETEQNIEPGPGSDAPRWKVMLCLLGGFRLVVAGQPVSLHIGGKSEALFAHLGLQAGNRIAREQLILALWPDSDLSHGLQSLNTLVYTVHKLLGPALGGAPAVLHEEGYYRLNVEAGIAVDIACFDRWVATGDHELRAGNEEAAYRVYEKAAALYRDDLYLVTNVEAVMERERLRGRYLTLLAQLADYHYRNADYSTCLTYLWRLLARDPCREDAHRLVMRCYVRRGERAAALHQYQVCVELLHITLEISPEPETDALVELIRRAPEQV